VAVPNLAGDLFLQSVWAAADSLAFAVGYQVNGGTGRDEGVIVRRDAGGVHAAAPSPHTGNRRLYAVWGSSAANLYAVGYQASAATGLDEGVILHSTDRGATWTAETTAAPGRPRRLYAVWGTGPGNVWAAGSSGTLLRFDGTRWHEVNSGVTTTLYGIGGNAAGQMYVVGDGQTVLRSGG
jgi:hypothetical protein